MNAVESHISYFIGWDVGAWYCKSNPCDAVVILNSKLNIEGEPWHGNLRPYINESKSSEEFISKLFSLCSAYKPANIDVTLSIDAPLGFPIDFVELVAGLKFVAPTDSYKTNPYLFRHTERYLSKYGYDPLSAINNQIGSQATKGMHFLAKFAPQVKRCGVWSDGKNLIAIETYPTPCEKSTTIGTLRRLVPKHPIDNKDEMDGLTCALIAYLFTNDPEKLIGPMDSVPVSEGWIWVPKDIVYEVKS